MADPYANIARSPEDRPCGSLRFEKCRRGFIFREDYGGTSREGIMPAIWAFSTIGEAADWLRDNFSPPGG